MGDQLDMFAAPPAPATTEPRDAREVKPAPAAPDPTATAFEAFLAENPLVIPEMLRLARARLDQGAKYISAKFLWEDLRSWLRTTGQPYKLNNNYTALAARKLVELEPRLEGVIRFRGGDK